MQKSKKLTTQYVIIFASHVCAYYAVAVFFYPFIPRFCFFVLNFALCDVHIFFFILLLGILLCVRAFTLPLLPFPPHILFPLHFNVHFYCIFFPLLRRFIQLQFFFPSNSCSYDLALFLSVSLVSPQCGVSEVSIFFPGLFGLSSCCVMFFVRILITYI